MVRIHPPPPIFFELMLRECKNSKIQGNIGLATAIQFFVSTNYIVSIPLTDSQDYDLIVDNGTISRVQVKTVYFKNQRGKYVVNLKVAGGNSKVNYIHKTNNQVLYDILFVLTEDNQRYMIPKSEIKTLKYQLVLTESYDQYKI